MYTTLAEVKTYLWIEGTSEDTRLTAILNGVESYVEKLIWDINLNDKTEKIKLSLVDQSSESFPLNNKNVTQIKTINWTDFTTKVEWVDYLINADDTVQVTGLCDLLTNLNFDVFSVTYTSWYNPIPDDLKNAIADLVGFEFAKELGKNIASEQTWPRRVTYSSSDAPETIMHGALQVIDSYRVLNLKHFT